MTQIRWADEQGRGFPVQASPSGNTGDRITVRVVRKGFLPDGNTVSVDTEGRAWRVSPFNAHVLIPYEGVVEEQGETAEDSARTPSASSADFPFNRTDLKEPRRS